MNDMHANPESITVDFTFLDETFHDQPDRLLLLLELMHKELLNSESLMMSALRNRQEAEYRDVKHKLLPSLTYMQIPGMKEVLRGAKEELMADASSFDPDKYLPAIAAYYAALKQAVSSKIASMKGH